MKVLIPRLGYSELESGFNKLKMKLRPLQLQHVSFILIAHPFFTQLRRLIIALKED